MTWILTHHGREYHLDRAPHPDTTPSLGEIAWALAHINRYTGHACRAYSVAEHSLLCADYARANCLGPKIELLCLMHDAHECITGDVSSPVKVMLGEVWTRFEDHHQRAVLQGYDLWDDFVRVKGNIKFIDLVALATERRDLTAYDSGIHAPWPAIDTPRGEIKAWHKADLNQDALATRRPSVWAALFERRAEALFATNQPTQ